MKTIEQALMDDVHYPIGKGFVENTIIRRGLDGNGTISTDILNSDAYKGALADCLYSLIQAVSFSESDKSVGSLSDKDKERILLRVNRLYQSIGEETIEIDKTPMVYFS